VLQYPRVKKIYGGRSCWTQGTARSTVAGQHGEDNVTAAGELEDNVAQIEEETVRATEGFDCFFFHFLRVVVAKMRNFGIFVFRPCNNSTL
jgi:hypothetical protein